MFHIILICFSNHWSIIMIQFCLFKLSVCLIVYKSYAAGVEFIVSCAGYWQTRDRDTIYIIVPGGGTVHISLQHSQWACCSIIVCFLKVWIMVSVSSARLLWAMQTRFWMKIIVISFRLILISPCFNFLPVTYHCITLDCRKWELVIDCGFICLNKQDSNIISRHGGNYSLCFYCEKLIYQT